MAREKVTITADRSKLRAAQQAVGAASVSDAVDRAVDELLRSARAKSDIAAYLANPPTSDEIALTNYRPKPARLADDTDWDALYGDEST